jgi:8-oxo-dGTP diphosphatase
MDAKEDHFHLGVKALIHNAEGKLLLLKLNVKRIKNPKGIWDLPGGRIQKNESLEDALRREVYEETGLQDITQINPFLMMLTDRRIPFQNDDVGLVLATYFCEISGDRPICLSEEHTDFGWFEPDIAAHLLMKNHPSELTDRLLTMSKSPRQ